MKERRGFVQEDVPSFSLTLLSPPLLFAFHCLCGDKGSWWEWLGIVFSLGDVRAVNVLSGFWHLIRSQRIAISLKPEQEARTRERLDQLEQQDFESYASLGERLKELTPEQSRQLLEETRSRAKTEELEFESSAELGDKILNEFWDIWYLQKELEDLAKLEESKEESSSSNTSSQLELPD